MSIRIFLLQLTRQQLKIILTTLGLGILSDSVLSYYHIIGFKYDVEGVHGFIPVWMIALWLAFALWMGIATYLKKHRVLVSIATVIFAPSSYLLGEKLGIVYLEKNTISLWFIGVYWLLLMNAVLCLKQK